MYDLSFRLIIRRPPGAHHPSGLAASGRFTRQATARHGGGAPLVFSQSSADGLRGSTGLALSGSLNKKIFEQESVLASLQRFSAVPAMDRSIVRSGGRFDPHQLVLRPATGTHETQGVLLIHARQYTHCSTDR
jgi:hypothetical protein